MSGGRRFYEAPAGDLRRSAPAALRNREPIAEILREWLPPHGLVVEVASGTGEHAAFFAKAFPQLEWQPTDAHPDVLGSIEAWRAESGAANLREPIALDAASQDWPIERADALLCINMVHISPWEASLGLIEGAAGLLDPGAPLILYGPWLERGIEPAASNLDFDANLRGRDPQWGLREVERFADAASPRFELEARRAMPANNLMLLFRRRQANSVPKLNDTLPASGTD